LALLALHRETEGLDVLHHAVELAPQDGRYWARYAYALEYTGRTTHARETAERALELLGPRGPRDWRASALATLALALSAEDQPTDALARADEALMLFPASPRTYLARATALQRLGRQEDAQGAAEQGLGLVQQQLASTPKVGELVAVQARLVQLMGHEQGLHTPGSAAESAGDTSQIMPDENW
jgi:tetratricopeptide (TPR) repeat protein